MIREPGYLAARARSPPIGAYARRKEARVFFSLVRSLSLSLALLLPGPTAITGIVVDQSGRPLPRAEVRLVGAAAGAAAATFTDSDGSFRLTATPGSECRIEASLSGFRTASSDCSIDAPLRVTLAVAPVQEAIVVTATRTNAPSGQLASGVTVFDADDIDRRHAPPLADLLRDAPGATVVRVGGPGSITSLFVRGGESNYTKVLLDGIPLNEPGGAFNLSNVTTENLERVEFVRGASSSLFGSDAMTGVIQLFTRRGATSRPDVRLAAEGGTFATARASASVAGRAGRGDYSAGITQFTTDNDAPNNDFTNTTLSGTGGMTLGHGATLRTVGRVERGRTGVPGQTAFGRPDLDAFFQRHDGVWGLSFDQAAGAIHQRASYGLAISHQASTNRTLDPPYTPSFDGRVAPFEFSDFAYDSHTDLRRHHASYQADLTSSLGAAGTHVDTALLDWDGERALLSDLLADTSTRASRDNVGVTVQHQALWPRVFATAGLRVERNDSFGTAVVPRGTAAVYLRKGGSRLGTTKISATAGKGIKEPTVLQSFSPAPSFLGNPDLLPERSRTIDAGVEQRLAGDRVKLELTWFDNRYRNIISTRTLGFSPFRSQFFNIGLTRARGAELSGGVALVSGIRARAGYTFTDSRILESTSEFSAVFAAGNPAFRRPRHSGFVDLSWNGARGSAGLTGSVIGRQADSDFSSLEPPILFNDGRALWGARASARLARRLDVTLAIDNLTDARYMEPLGYPALGRAVRAGLRSRW
jgi:vitamin B12 transporter